MPSHSKYAAPASLITVNAVAETVRIAANPAAEAVAHSISPVMMPAVVRKAARRPCSSATLVTTAVSAPGVIVCNAASPINVSSRVSTDISPSAS